MIKWKDCFCNCHCNVKGHSDDTGVCPCEKCNCNPQGATVNNDECLSCQQTKQNAAICTAKKEKNLEHVVSRQNCKKKTSKTLTSTKPTPKVKPMTIADLFKKNIIFIPIVASLVVGSFTSIRYVLNLTQTINESETQIVNLQRDLDAAQKELTKMNTRLSSAEATWQMAENLYRTLADQVREHSYDIKDLNR